MPFGLTGQINYNVFKYSPEAFLIGPVEMQNTKPPPRQGPRKKRGSEVEMCCGSFLW
jgi:hypothetical protein